MQGERAWAAGDRYINGIQLAKRLGTGASTLTQWVKAGKLPKPKTDISGMMLFDKARAVV